MRGFESQNHDFICASCHNHSIVDAARHGFAYDELDGRADLGAPNIHRAPSHILHTNDFDDYNPDQYSTCI
jgi:hypothetical protein